jgi:hypothetical protein
MLVFNIKKIMNKNLFFLTLIALLAACGQAGQKQSVATPDSESAESPMNMTAETKHSAEPSAFQSGIITSRGVDEFVIGGTIPSLSEKYTVQKRMKMVEEGNEEPYYAVSENEKEMLYLEMEYNYETEQYLNNMRAIEIVSEKYKTLENIGVHSTIEEFIKKYTDFDIWFSIIGGLYVIETPQYENILFILDEKGFIGELDIEGDKTRLKYDDFDSNTKIMQIRIY